ncbi:MAG: transcriptional repressor [Clostridia bacterium]|nr:transcriptional repressor [Clostridia bacterium]
MTLSKILELLKAHGYKLTKHRKCIVTLLMSNIENLLSVEELYFLCKKEDTAINRSTVYRNIEILGQLNLLYKHVNDDGSAKFKLICTEEHHHHLICDLCGKIIIYNQCENSIYTQFAQSHGFILTGHTLELHGICSNCQLRHPI